MEKGTVKFFDETKGFGFIKAESGEEYFVHAKGVQGQIRDNDNVKFELEEGRRGLQAVKVSLA